MKLKSLITTCLLALLFSGATAKDYKYKTVAGDLSQTRIYTLDNGLTVYLSVNKEKPRIQTYIAVRTGSRNDPAETTGLAHYLEHLMFKGTQQFGTTDYAKEKPLLDDIEHRYEVYRKTTDEVQRKQMYHEIDSVSQLAARYNIPNEYDKLMAAIGSEGSNAYTGNDMTCYVENIPANEVENWAKVQSDRFQNMVIRGFHTELEAVYEEYNIGLGSDNDKMWESMGKLLYPTHPYGTQTTIGTQEHLKNPSIVNIKNYFNKYYVPNNVAICMAGDMDMDKVIATIDKYFGSWKPGNNITAPQYAPVAELTAPRDTTVVGNEAERVMLGWKFDGVASMQTDTLDIVSQMLSNGKAGLMDLNLDQKMKYLGGGAGTNSMAEYTIFVMLGAPKEGQSLDEVKALLLGEIENLKNGNFSDDLLPSIINNTKLSLYRQMEDNDERADMFVDAFINGKKWSDVVGYLDRISKLKKQDIIDFARRHFGNNYAVVYKRQGEDMNQKKIDKPAITAIPSNRDYQSKFVSDIIAAETEPIQPRFVNFDTDLKKFNTKKTKLPVLYVKNTENGRFSLQFRFNVGDLADNRYGLAASYIDYLGTDKMTAEEIKQQFYKLACSYGVSVGAENTTISLSGLAENMPKALRLLEDLIDNAKVDNEAYSKYIALVEKSRSDAKHNQRSNYSALCDYATYGKYNPTLNLMSTEDMKKLDPKVLINLIKGL
ncbi:MAG: insulinase family protein, partial [Prevotella sp.]